MVQLGFPCATIYDNRIFMFFYVDMFIVVFCCISWSITHYILDRFAWSVKDLPQALLHWQYFCCYLGVVQCPFAFGLAVVWTCLIS